VRGLVISALLATSAFAASGFVVSGFSRTTPQSQQPTFRTGTNLVQVDAVVADGSGRPVTDLTAADFEVADDGAPVPVTAFRFISAAAAEGWHSDVISPIRNEDDETREAAIEGVRVVAIFLDEYHVQWENALRAVPALVQFVRTLPPADLLGVYGVMDSTRDVRFTRDREPAIAKIQAFQGRFNQFTPPKYPVEEEHLRHPQQIPQIRMQISSSTVEAIVTHLGAISERRKSLIVLSEKLDYGLSGGGALSQMSDRAMFVSELVGIANRFNVSLYPFDPGGLRVQGSRGQMGMSTIDMFRSLADDTGGRAIVNRNEFGPALQQVSSDAAAYYLLGFVSSHPSDGKYHKIAIRVKRRGVTLRARAGYLSPKPEEVRTESAAAEVPPAVTKALSQMVDALRPSGNELVLPKRAFETAAAAKSSASGPAPLVGTPAITILRGTQQEHAARPEFERTQRIAVRAAVAGDPPPAVTASLLSRTGQELTKLPVTMANGGAEVTIALANVGAGDYVIRFTGERGGDRIEQYVALRVLR